jgi:hypothetical protein
MANPPKNRNNADKPKEIPPVTVNNEALFRIDDLLSRFALMITRNPIIIRMLPVVQNKVARMVYSPVVCPIKI